MRLRFLRSLREQLRLTWMEYLQWWHHSQLKYRVRIWEKDFSRYCRRAQELADANNCRYYVFKGETKHLVLNRREIKALKAKHVLPKHKTLFEITKDADFFADPKCRK